MVLVEVHQAATMTTVAKRKQMPPLQPAQALLLLLPPPPPAPALRKLPQGCLFLLRLMTGFTVRLLLGPLLKALVPRECPQ